MNTRIPIIAALALLCATALSGCELFMLIDHPHLRMPPPPPANSTLPVRDMCGNQWTLAPEKSGGRQLLVLPAQATDQWIDPGIVGVTPGDWREVVSGEDGLVWLIGTRTIRFDPRRPKSSAVEAATPATQPASQWQVVARMPTSNHDITAAVLDDEVYVAGGLTADYGFPPRSRSSNWVLAFSLQMRPPWRFMQLRNDRVYCATAAFDEKIWVIGGDVIAADGKRSTTTTVECFSVPPKDEAEARFTSKTMREYRKWMSNLEGPASPIARLTPLALVANNRLYVVGCAAGDREQVGKMESLGVGETAWRPEQDGPAGMGPLAGATLNDKLYIVVPKKGLAVFDAKANRWEMIPMSDTSPGAGAEAGAGQGAGAETPGAGVPRSCQMAAYRGEIWMMGGVDVSDPLQTTIFDPRTGQFRAGPPLPVPLSWGAAAVVNDQLLIIGGAGLRSDKDRTYVYSDRVYMLKP